MKSCLDLREYIDDPLVHKAFSKLVSGKQGYQVLIERKNPLIKCKNCEAKLKGDEVFCPNCGAKQKPNNCPNCKAELKDSYNFCPKCGEKL